jgi:hypothetical protein
LQWRNATLTRKHELNAKARLLEISPGIRRLTRIGTNTIEVLVVSR